MEIETTVLNYNRSNTMNKIENVQDFKKFLKKNRDKLLEKAINIEDIPNDDEWVNEVSWDEMY